MNVVKSDGRYMMQASDEPQESCRGWHMKIGKHQFGYILELESDWEYQEACQLGVERAFCLF